MAIATGTAIAIAAGASAGASVASAKMQSNAAKNAAKTQAASADRANALSAEAQRYQNQQLAPFAGAGTGAVNTLSQLLGVPAGGQFASPGMGFGGPGGGYGGPAGAPRMPVSRLSVSPEMGQMYGSTNDAAVPRGPMGSPGPPPMGPGGAGPAPPRMPQSQNGRGPVYDGRTPLKLSDFMAQM